VLEGNISSATTSYDPLQRGMEEYQPRRREPRNLPPGFAGGFTSPTMTARSGITIP